MIRGGRSNVLETFWALPSSSLEHDLARPTRCIRSDIVVSYKRRLQVFLVANAILEFSDEKSHYVGLHSAQEAALLPKAEFDQNAFEHSYGF